MSKLNFESSLKIQT